MDVSSISSLLSPVSGGKAEGVAVAGKQPERELSVEQLASQTGNDEAAPDAMRKQVEAAVATIQDYVQAVRRDINFSLEDGGGRVVVKVTDAGSGDVIRQIPSEEALQLAENLSEVRSLLFKAEA
ncbi:flagellar protein FlaG [Pseudomonas sp. URMO17WK12:I4]|uniref:flagellar protein FlaG n=1 Tax=Pseudomonas sp. URMO17WK12:I4 TaxID=1283292 RepID=UPI0004860BEB|nr:flagellar protein FlaG [Pseudomonas sp. URMO17WK12:I4]